MLRVVLVVAPSCCQHTSLHVAPIRYYAVVVNKRARTLTVLRNDGGDVVYDMKQRVKNYVPKVIVMRCLLLCCCFSLLQWLLLLCCCCCCLLSRCSVHSHQHNATSQLPRDEEGAKEGAKTLSGAQQLALELGE